MGTPGSAFIEKNRAIASLSNRPSLKFYHAPYPESSKRQRRGGGGSYNPQLLMVRHTGEMMEQPLHRVIPDWWRMNNGPFSWL
jgi:hypothetical protein